MDALYGSCRLSISGWDADLSGPPDALLDLAHELENAADASALSVIGGRVGLRRTTADRLTISVEGGTLWIEGNQNARSIVLSAMRHAAHDSFPLVVGADWPE
jgi:hypothetical protein